MHTHMCMLLSALLDNTLNIRLNDTTSCLQSNERQCHDMNRVSAYWTQHSKETMVRGSRQATHKHQITCKSLMLHRQQCRAYRASYWICISHRLKCTHLQTAHSVAGPPSCCSRSSLSTSLTNDLTACLEAGGAAAATLPPSASCKEAINASSNPAGLRHRHKSRHVSGVTLCFV